jgi:MFS family permease
VEASAIGAPPLGRQPEFRKLWLGQTISAVGDQFTLLAIPLIAATTLDASPSEMGVLVAAGWLPHLLFSLHAGHWIDRRGRRRRRMIMCDLGRAAALGTLALAQVSEMLTTAHLVAVAFVVGSLSVLFDLSWSTLFVAVVPRREFIAANARLSQSRALASVVGPAVAGALLHVLRSTFAMVVDACSYLGSAISLSRVNAAEPVPDADPAALLRSQLTTGIKFVVRENTYRASLLAFSTSNFFSCMFTSLFVLYATRELGIRAGVVGLIMGGGAVGGLLGAAVSSRLAHGIGIGPSMILGMSIRSVPMLLVPAASGPAGLVVGILFIALFLGSLGVVILDVNGNSLNAAVVPEAIRARVTGAYRTINYGARPLGALVGGALGSMLGLRTTLFVAAGGIALAVGWLLASPIRSLREVPDAARGR